MAAQEALPFLERASMLCLHYGGDSCVMERKEATTETEKAFCEFDSNELDDAMECAECLRLIIEHAALRTGRSQNPKATLTLIRRFEGFENFGVQ